VVSALPVGGIPAEAPEPAREAISSFGAVALGDE
jgi:hypothetical protein